jgi:hypothetical protein
MNSDNPAIEKKIFKERLRELAYQLDAEFMNGAQQSRLLAELAGFPPLLTQFAARRICPLRTRNKFPEWPIGISIQIYRPSFDWFRRYLNSCLCSNDGSLRSQKCQVESNSIGAPGFLFRASQKVSHGGMPPFAGIVRRWAEQGRCQEATTDIQTSTLAARNLTLQSGGATTLEAVEAQAREKLAISAGQDVYVLSAEETRESAASVRQEQGSFFNVGRKSWQTDVDALRIHQVGSKLAGAEVDIQAGRDLVGRTKGARVDFSGRSVRNSGVSEISCVKRDA